MVLESQRGSGYRLCLGSQLKYRVEVEVTGEESEIENKTLCGHTDLLVYSPPDLQPNSVVLQSELKPPFKSLFHSTAETQKNQLVCQLMGLKDLQSNRVNSVLSGCLTDLFAIILCFHFQEGLQPKTRNYRPVYYVTHSVVEPQAYFLHLLLLLCPFETQRKLFLHQPVTTSVGSKRKKRDGDGNDDDREDSKRQKRSKSNHVKPSAKTSSKPQSQSRRGKTKGKEKASLYENVIDDEEEQFAQQQELELWFAHYEQYSCLTEENLARWQMNILQSAH